jgi:diacylglycerol kinase (ATP)
MRLNRAPGGLIKGNDTSKPAPPAISMAQGPPDAELVRRVRDADGAALSHLYPTLRPRSTTGLLEVVAIEPRTIFGSLAVSVRVLTRRCCGHRIVQHWQGRTVVINTESPQLAQLDGEPVGELRRLRMRVDRAPCWSVSSPHRCENVEHG